MEGEHTWTALLPNATDSYRLCYSLLVGVPMHNVATPLGLKMLNITHKVSQAFKLTHIHGTSVCLSLSLQLLLLSSTPPSIISYCSFHPLSLKFILSFSFHTFWIKKLKVTFFPFFSSWFLNTTVLSFSLQ